MADLTGAGVMSFADLKKSKGLAGLRTPVIMKADKPDDAPYATGAGVQALSDHAHADRYKHNLDFAFAALSGMREKGVDSELIRRLRRAADGLQGTLDIEASQLVAAYRKGVLKLTEADANK